MKLAFSDTGTKRPTFVLIHGWTCNHTAMEPIARAFCNQHCINVDLLGHGLSPLSEDYSITTQARAVLDITPTGSVLIGHSMGGQIAIEAARLAPEKVAAAILLDPALIVPHEKAQGFAADLRSQLARMADADVSAMMEAFGRRQIVKAEHPDAVDDLIQVMSRTDPAVTRAAWNAICDWKGAEALATVQCPILVIAIDKAMNRPGDLARVNRNVMTGQVAGSGHMVQFEVMDQISAMMRRFLTLVGIDLTPMPTDA